MKSLKMVLAIALLSSMVAGSAFAQSAVRGDEMIKNPQEYRLGDSDDLQGDQMKVDQVCNDEKAKESVSQQEDLSKAIKYQNHLLKLRSFKHADYI